MNSTVLGAIAVLLVGAFGIYLYSSNDGEVELGSFAASEVAEHNSSEDCWTYIDNKVYDITEYIPRHPGGGEILRACGNDGTTLFTQRQTDTGDVVGSGTPHSENAASLLEDYRIGDLAE